MDLSETAVWTKRLMVAAAAILLVFYSGKYSFKFAKGLWLKFNPPKITPTVSFGKLPPLTIPSLKMAEGSTPTYIVDTPTGRLPSFPVILPVFKVITPKTTHQYEERARTLAASLGFLGNYTSVSASLFSWKEKGATLRMNVITRSFSIETEPSEYREDINHGTVFYPTEAKEKAKLFLSQAGLDLTGYDDQEVTLAATDDGGFRQKTSVSESDVAFVEFFRSIKPGQYSYKILGPNPKKGLIEVAISGKRKSNRSEEIMVKYMFRELEAPANLATYPIKPVIAAYDELQAGKAAITYFRSSDADFFASYRPLKPQEIKIREVSLGYFEPETLPTYVQPIYVFSGKAFLEGGKEAEYIAYVPAVDNGWIK